MRTLIAITVAGLCAADASAQAKQQPNFSHLTPGVNGVAGTTVRLKGVDAAELGTARGEDARRVMATLVTGKLTCRLTGEKTYGREVGYCATADGTDINLAIIAQGAALACPRYDDRYVLFEQAAALAAQTRSSYCVKRF